MTRYLLLGLMLLVGCTPPSPPGIEKQREEFQRIEKPLAPTPLPDPVTPKPGSSVGSPVAGPAVCDDPDPPKAEPAAVYIYTDTSWCAPCVKQKPHFDRTRKVTQAAGYKWVDNGAKAKGHVRLYSVVNTAKPPPYLDGRGIPCAVAVVGGRVVREWGVSDGNFDPEVLYYLIYGDAGKKTRKITGWDLESLKQAIAVHATKTDVRTRWWIAGMTPLFHLTHDPHNWPLHLVSQLDVESQLWLHDMDHRGLLSP